MNYKYKIKKINDRIALHESVKQGGNIVLNVKKPLFLIGFMGAGKTSVGEKLAEICGYSVIDTDQEIARKMKMEIPQIFAQYGEERFREIETEGISGVITKICDHYDGWRDNIKKS